MSAHNAALKRTYRPLFLQLPPLAIPSYYSEGGVRYAA